MKRPSLKYLLGFRAPIPRILFLGIAATSIIFLLVVWWTLSALNAIPDFFIPSPGRVIAAGWKMFNGGGFSQDVLASALRILVAFLLSALLAIPIGIIMSSFKTAEAFFEPFVDFVRYVPVPALLPLFVLWTGIGETPKILVLFFGTFFQLVLIIKDDADNVPQINFDLARTMGATSWELLRDVLLPFLLPEIYDRLRVTLGWCWTYLVIAELVAVRQGIGHAIKEAQRFNDAEQLFVCFITLGAIGLLTDFVAKLFFHILFPYAERTRV